MARNDNGRRAPRCGNAGGRRGRLRAWAAAARPGGCGGCSHSEDIVKGLVCQAEGFRRDCKTVTGAAEGCERDAGARAEWMRRVLK